MPDISRQIWSIKNREEEFRTRQLAKNLGLEYISLIGYPFSAEVFLRIPKRDIQKYKIIPYLKVGKKIKNAVLAQPDQKTKSIFAKFFPKMELSFSLCSETSFKSALLSYDRMLAEQQKQRQRQGKIEKGGIEFTKIIKNIEDIASHLKKVSTTQLLDLILNGAVITQASDIHLEPTKVGCRLRFRIDGVLQDIGTLTRNQFNNLDSRIKNLATVKLDVKSKPQDGRFTVRAGGHPLDIRVSTLPGAYGENIVMRLLLSDNPLLTLKQIGFNQQVHSLIIEAITRPHGMVLNTGPTGSGKTTTLYAILGELNKPAVKIITIEDPIEYQISGIDQTQVSKANGYSFVNALSSAVRQDPDIIMVGEVRDPGTAKVALQAALTGHLVLTTLHTNTASGAIPRLLDMGIEPYLLAGSINLIIAQRLVRRVCQECQGKRKTCLACQGTGYKGRLPIVEALKPSHEFNELITRKASVEEFEAKTRELGMETMLEDGMNKVKKGLTTKQEIERVTRD